MDTVLACIPCLARQALEAAQFVTDDRSVRERILREVLRWVSEMDLSQSPPAAAQRMHRRLRELTGVADPYRAAKDRFNRIALALWPALAAKVAEAADPLAEAVHLAIAGNVIDLAVNGDLIEADARQAVMAAAAEPFDGDVDAFRQAVEAADSILYLADNAGEIVFDRLLIEQLPTGRVTVVVRGGPVLNDATRADAQVAGLCDIVEVIDTGSDAPGTILADCDESFCRRFATAGLIVAKGQGNFESLSHEPADVYFLLKAKCPVVAAQVGRPIGTHMLLHSSCPGERVATSTKETHSMKVAIPTVDGKLCMHFGHCQRFAFVEVADDGKTIAEANYQTPPPHEPGVLPRWLHEQGANVVIAGGMGPRALGLFAQNGIEVVVGAPSETPEQIVTTWLAGALEAGENVCDH